MIWTLTGSDDAGQPIVIEQLSDDVLGEGATVLLCPGQGCLHPKEAEVIRQQLADANIKAIVIPFPVHVWKVGESERPAIVENYDGTG